MVIRSKGATSFTKKVNDGFLKELPFDDVRDFEDAKRGFLGTIEGDGIYHEDGHLVWDIKAYDFENTDVCPDTVNPSLWRQTRLNNIHGLFQVNDRVFQIRNLDIANMTIIEGSTGIIVIDCMTADESAKAALDLYYKHRGVRPIKAVVITHSHADHYGGVLGIVDQKDVASGRIPVYVPDDFLFEVMSENAYAGNIMSRRTYDQYGTILPKGPTGQVDLGLGKSMTVGGTHSMVMPSKVITDDIKRHTMDGVTMEFMLTQDTEAPSEFVIYIPEMRLLITSEIVTHTFHNLYTLRGAEVRDARLWWRSVDRMIQRYGYRTDVICAVHHWPTWGQERCLRLLETHRDSYKYIHDQSLRLMNLGYTSIEVAEMMELPPSLGKEWAMRGYYGTWNHGAKAIYQKYLGWFDMNPANLHPLPPEEAAKEYVEFGGGPEEVLSKVKNAYRKGKYRWAAEAGKHLVFAYPENKDALNILADTYEQLGYQCECGTWRCTYLMGAMELRMAAIGQNPSPQTSTVSPALTNVMDDDMFFDFMALHLNGPKAQDEMILIELEQTDRRTKWSLKVKNGVLNFHQNKKYAEFDAHVRLERDDLSHLVLGLKDVDELVRERKMRITGNVEKVRRLFELMDVFTLDMNIMIP